eukprot:8224793-Pyramimonas_sp.AAC.1
MEVLKPTVGDQVIEKGLAVAASLLGGVPGSFFPSDSIPEAYLGTVGVLVHPVVFRGGLGHVA